MCWPPLLCKLQRASIEDNLRVCSTVCLMSRTFPLAAASYSHLIVVHSAAPVARPADAFNLPLTESIVEQAFLVRTQRHRNIDESALPCPCQSSIQLSRDGRAEKTLWTGAGHLWHGVPCFLQRHGV